MFVLLNSEWIFSGPWQFKCSINGGWVEGNKHLKENSIVDQIHCYRPVAIVRKRTADFVFLLFSVQWWQNIVSGLLEKHIQSLTGAWPVLPV